MVPRLLERGKRLEILPQLVQPALRRRRLGRLALEALCALRGRADLVVRDPEVSLERERPVPELLEPLPARPQLGEARRCLLEALGRMPLAGLGFIAWAVKHPLRSA